MLQNQDLNYLYTFSSFLPNEAPHEIWFYLAKWFQRRSLKMADRRMTTDDDHWSTISSPCEPDGSVELKRNNHFN